MNVYALNRPKKISGWYTFPNTVLTHMEFDGCSNTLKGVCTQAPSLEQCLKISRDAGYFVQKNGEKNGICVPLTEKETSFHHVYNRLRDQSYYPNLKNTKVTFFIREKYVYPPKMANTLFYEDIFTLKNIETDKTLNFITELSFQRDEGTPLQFIPENISHVLSQKYVTVKNGDVLSLNIPKTSYIMNLEKNPKMVSEASVDNLPDSNFSIFAENARQGDDLNYSQKFYFVKGENLLIFSNGTLSLAPLSQKVHTNHLFSLVPKIKVHYCSRGDCLPIDLEMCEYRGGEAFYKNVRVTRNPACWGLCEEKNIFPLLFFAIVLAIFIIFFLKK